MPTARFYKESSFGFTFNYNDPDQKITMTSSPFDWLEASFFYTNIDGKPYCSNPLDPVCQQDLKDKFQKLSNDMTTNIKAAVPVVKKYNHNILFMKSVQALIRFNTELEDILKKFTKN